MKSFNQITKKAFIGLSLILLYIFTSISFCILPIANAQITSSAKVSLFAKTGSGDYYTLYPDGIKKEDAYIGGFKFTVLDPLEENIYFFDPILKVIAKINLQSGKVYKVIGKPKSSIDLDYSTAVKFADASLNKLTDFTIDKYGNIYLLIHTKAADPNYNIPIGDPRILKASFKDGTIKEVLKIDDQFKRAFASSLLNDISFSLTGLTYSPDGYLYLYGSANYSSTSSASTTREAVILKYNPLTNVVEFYGGTSKSKTLGFNPKLTINTENPGNPTTFSLKGLAYDHSNICYLSSSDITNSTSNLFAYKITQNTDGTSTQESFIGDSTGSSSDIGDGGLARSAYVSLSGSNCICGDKNGDMFIADSGTNRIRKILKDSTLITTVVGSGTESLSYGEFKSPKSISLQSPNTLFVDKANNTYIVELNRILLVSSLITHEDKPLEQIKVANIAITKIADRDVINPKGVITQPDLSLDYTYAGDQNVEVTGSYIPDNTGVMISITNSDGTINPTSPAGKLTGGKALIPVKVEAGASKIIKAETDPFIPAPGIYLPSNAPQIQPGQLPPELTPPLTPKRDAVNLVTKNTAGNVTGNLIPISTRFNFSYTGWQRFNGGDAKLNAAIDPDNISTDATLITFGSSPNTIWLDSQAPTGGSATFSVWMKTTDSSTISVPIGIGPACPDLNRNQTSYWASAGWEGCNYPNYVSNNQTTSLPYFVYTTVSVTPTWQKFSVTGGSTFATIGNGSKSFFIGGLNKTINKKVYIWGARSEVAP